MMLSNKTKDFAFMTAFISGIIIMVLASIVVSGGTFGQRCTEAGYVGEEYDECLYRLRTGGTE
jgi:hypothetical protein